MTKTDINKYKEILEARQAELAEVLRNREAITIEKSPDALDEVQNAAERELAIRNLDRESNLLRNVRAALATNRRRNLRHLRALRRRDQHQADQRCAVDSLLHCVPGASRPRSGRGKRIPRRAAGQRRLVAHGNTVAYTLARIRSGFALSFVS